MKKLEEGLYEELINKLCSKQIASEEELEVSTKKVDSAEASEILAKYLGRVAKKTLDLVKDQRDDNHNEAKDLNNKVRLINGMIKLISEAVDCDEDILDYQLPEETEQLLAVHNKGRLKVLKGGKASELRPETSLAVSSLFTGAIREPQLATELKSEILSCNKICMLVSFIKWSGLRIFLDELKSFTANGGRLEVITTSYMGATDIKAVEELSKLPNAEIKVSYDTKRTRLHAKAYIFYRKTGFHTAYIGSSNISNAALTSGLEWNVKITQQDQPEIMEKVKATFISYWNSAEFEGYDTYDQERLTRALQAERFSGEEDSSRVYYDLLPYYYQQEILDKLEAERNVRNYWKNLIIAATGTGKTMIAAFDYKRFYRSNKRSNLLFVAHREEILKQSLDSFRMVLKDANFGELLVGQNRPSSLENLFVSVQSFNSKELTKVLREDHFDYIVVDEFHHAAAPTYQEILNYFKPKIMLGLTATPERMDGKHNELYDYFDNRIAAEIRLTEAIDRKLLCPFQYFGIADEVDLSELRWSRGGYDTSALNNVYVLNERIALRRAEHIILNTQRYVNDMAEVKGLGFCVSVEHAEFMAKVFNEKGIASIALTGKSDVKLRNSAKGDLVKGRLKFIFVVDIYNEGVDIPEVNTVLFLRPTESLTVFLQQLGRGLRLAEGKDCLTVLDFIGQANKRYNFEDKFRAILSSNTANVADEIKKGFVAVPKGCYITLEKKAKEYVLNNIKSSIGSKIALVNKVRNFAEDTGQELNLRNFITYYPLSPKEIYGKYSFGELCEAAGIYAVSTEPGYNVVKKIWSRLASLNSRRLITFFTKLLVDKSYIPKGENELLMLAMLQYTIWNKSWEACGFSHSLAGIEILRNSPRVKAEILDLLQYGYDNIDFIDEDLNLGFPCPLDLHCEYSRDQILIALGDNINCREGVKYIKHHKVDVFFITLNKSEKDYSPTTMYKDYSINENLFHWQSQSQTSEKSPTGQRYIKHRSLGSKVLLFVRENKEDKLTKKAEVYTCLGEGEYVSHEGSSPMSIIWKLKKPIPAKFLKKTNKALLG